eukprot:NODE_19074_length_861_cov_2.813351.p1 GENE.NODE_19074_length_861_cov_2.813351~~NODE_19074_length_861_cov_2.813351.p1  ORF type:complete len:169 (-),score=37.47 NODE_19074_length_861_cov_2.813351:200-706(-)
MPALRCTIGHMRAGGSRYRQIHEGRLTETARNLSSSAYVPTLANRHSAAVRHAAAAITARRQRPEDDSHQHGEACGHVHDACGHVHEHDEACGHVHVPGNEASYGLSSFVYRRAGPGFDAARLAALVSHMPVVSADLSFYEAAITSALDGCLVEEAPPQKKVADVARI